MSSAELSLCAATAAQRKATPQIGASATGRLALWRGFHEAVLFRGDVWFGR